MNVSMKLFVPILMGPHTKEYVLWDGVWKMGRTQQIQGLVKVDSQQVTAHVQWLKVFIKDSKQIIPAI